MFSRRRAVLALAAIPVALAQTHEFGWSFDGLQTGTTTIAQCASLKVVLSPPNTSVTTTGTAPYTMLAFEGGKEPTFQVIGTSKDSLSWQVRHAPGAQLLITIIDGKGNYGGFPDVMYTVGEGSSSSCTPTSTSSPSFSVVSNVTSSLSTCAPWGLTISGGTPPYSVSLAALGASVITNVTGEPSQNRFTYINRASPQTHLIAGVTDSTGRWGVSSVPITTTGSSDVTCGTSQSSWDSVAAPSLSSSVSPSSTSVSASLFISSIAPSTAATSAPSSSGSSSSSKAGPIAGGVVGGLAALLLLGALLFCLRRRKTRARSLVTPYDSPSTAGALSDGASDSEKTGRQTGAPSSPPPVGYYLEASAQDTGAAPGPRTIPAPASASSGGGISTNPPSTLAHTTTSGATTAVGADAATPAPASSRSMRKAREAQEAADAARSAEVARHAPTGPASFAQPVAGPSGQTHAPPPPRSEPDTVFVQHEDGGVASPVVVELPPAYTDRRLAGQQP